MAYIVNVSVELIQGIKDIWDCLRMETPRPLCPDKFYAMCQSVKARYEAELPWMEAKLYILSIQATMIYKCSRISNHV